MSPVWCLAGYGLAVAALSPPVLARVTRAGRWPRLGIAAWLLAAASVLASALSAAAVLAGSRRPLPAALGWTVAATVLTRLAWCGAQTWLQARTRRRWHAQAVRLLGRRDPASGVVLVPTADRLVYCLPGPHPTVVVTAGARAALSPGQLAAVLAHEQAHLGGRHHLLLTAAYALGRAVPRLALFAHVGPVVATLLEMRADDAAAAYHGRATVAAALAAMSAVSAPAGALGASGPAAAARAARLCRAEPAWRRRLGRTALALTVAALASGPYLAAALPPCPHPLW